jgi:hypothetical protein
VTVTDSESGVVPVVEPTPNQLPPVVVEAAAVNVTADPVLVVTITLCDATGEPMVALKVRPVELRLRVGGAAVGIGVVTVSVTGTDTGLLVAPVDANETLPL